MTPPQDVGGPARVEHLDGTTFLLVSGLVCASAKGPEAMSHAELLNVADRINSALQSYRPLSEVQDLRKKVLDAELLAVQWGFTLAEKEKEFARALSSLREVAEGMAALLKWISDSKEISSATLVKASDLFSAYSAWKSKYPETPESSQEKEGRP